MPHFCIILYCLNLCTDIWNYLFISRLIMLLHFFVPILLILQSHFSNGEVFTALIDMEKLVTTEFEIVRHLENYIQAEEEKLNRMRA